MPSDKMLNEPKEIQCIIYGKMDSGHLKKSKKLGWISHGGAIALINFMCQRKEMVDNFGEAIKELRRKQQEEK